MSLVLLLVCVHVGLVLALALLPFNYGLALLLTLIGSNAAIHAIALIHDFQTKPRGGSLVI